MINRSFVKDKAEGYNLKNTTLMLQTISESQTIRGKFPEQNNEVSGSETLGSASVDPKQLKCQEQSSSSSIRANTTNDESL